MPETGFDDVPMMPTMRDETVTKKKPKITTRMPISSFEPKPLPGSCGISAMTPTRMSEPKITQVIGRSCSVRATGPPLPFFSRRLLKLSRKAAAIVGRVLISVMRPAAATAPAPMKRT